MDDTITIEAVGDEHTDPLPVAAALSASIPTHTGTRAPFVGQEDRPHGARLAHILAHMQREVPPARPAGAWYRSNGPF